MNDIVDESEISKALQARADKFKTLDAVKKSTKQETSTEENEDLIDALSEAGEFTKAHELAINILNRRGIELNHKDQTANRKMRFKYSKWVFRYLVGYSIFVALILVLAGFKIGNFILEPEVLKFLVGSTAASAIGLVAAVTTGLFHKK